MKQELTIKVCGYQYTVDGKEWKVTTDYINGNIYLSQPHEENDIESIKAFGQAIIQAMRDFKKERK